jgi:Holliday junction resolvase RusA-like endonuclease
MSPILIHIPGAPIGKQRPIAGRSFAGHTTLRTPKKTLNYEALVALAGQQAMAGRPLIETACEVEMHIAVPIPASWSKKKRAEALAWTLLPTTKPDIDNVEKAIFDGLNGVVWKDDVQVVSVTKRKRYSDTPGVAVTVRAGMEKEGEKA